MSEMPSDAQLVAWAVGGDQDAFAHLMARHERGVLSVALSRLPSLEEARDAAQETFVRAYLSLSSLRDPGAFRAWVTRIARGTATDAARRLQREVLAGDLAGEEGERAQGPSETAAVSPEVRQALERLPRLSRLAVILHYTGGYSHAEVAELLGLTPAAVKTRLSRALGRLRKEMAAMVAGTLARTVVVLVCRIRVPGKGANVAVGYAGEMSPTRRLREAESCYDLTCLDPDLAEEPAWAAQRQAALARTAGLLIENGLESGATSLTISRAPVGEAMGVRAVCTTASEGGSWEWSSESLWAPLRDYYAAAAGLRGAQGSGKFGYGVRGKRYTLEATVGRDQVRLDIRGGATRSPGARTLGAADEAQAVAPRIVAAGLEQAVRDGASAVRARVAKNGAEFTIEERVGEEWQTVMRFTAQTKLHVEGKKTARRGTPTEQPLWGPVREEFAARCGIELREGAQRQTGSLPFELEGRSYELRAVLTPKTITVRGW